MKSKYLHWLAIILIIETGLVHFTTAQHEFEEAAYIGYLFIANFLASLVAAYWIYRKQTWGWWLGFGVAAGSMVGYVWSRTLGLPGTEVEGWLLPSGVLAMGVEGLFILVLLMRPWRYTTGIEEKQAKASPWRQFLPAFTMFLMVLAVGAASQLDTIPSLSGHDHVFSIADVKSLPLLSSNILEEQYGMRVTQVAISALDSIVDVRLKVIDPEKADTLLESHAALLVDDQALVLAPHMHTHTKMKPGQVYVMFFPTQNNTVHTGSEVSLVFEDVRVDPVVAK